MRTEIAETTLRYLRVYASAMSEQGKTFDRQERFENRPDADDLTNGQERARLIAEWKQAARNAEGAWAEFMARFQMMDKRTHEAEALGKALEPFNTRGIWD